MHCERREETWCNGADGTGTGLWPKSASTASVPAVSGAAKSDGSHLH